MTAPDIDRDALEAAALAATPGEWIWKRVGSFSTPRLRRFLDRHNQGRNPFAPT